MNFIDLHVHSISSRGVDTPLRLAYHARKLGIEIGLCDGAEVRPEPGIAAVGVEVRATNKGAFKAQLKTLSRRFDYVVITGGDEVSNRLAVSDDRADILAHPSIGRSNSGIDPYIAKKARENSVAVEISLGEVINSRGSQRVAALRNIKRNVMLSRKYGFELTACTGAKCRYDLRAAAGVAGILKAIGLSGPEMRGAMIEAPKRIIGR